ncbi:hypothetical protein CXG81DRAFT_26798 [Caulochytrium protostelioides]|uniref:BIR-domain-containing protein n=1 Tax=Caulochytrium protostelioides TaxID=1555241 RepID=A0A4P9X5R5_9FUNG|nr:hypothetical protein CXG81DRAFT_26798 [Caulochytrium protostelioides]|eukprot:RKP00483.1 hypothetical protein CXG81DRAFT_26798 [Caulochytrium protostelioides]
MECYDNRLQSFKTHRWPYKPKDKVKATPVLLAQAGFYLDPDSKGDSEGADRVVCFLCHQALSGWRDRDFPLVEHDRACAWTTVQRLVATQASTAPAKRGRKGAAASAAAAAAAAVTPGPDTDRTDPAVLAPWITAFAATYGAWWPHPPRAAAAAAAAADAAPCPSAAHMAAAGFHATPSPETADTATCALCALALDGWEPTDVPLHEHARRSPACPFIVLQARAHSAAGAGALDATKRRTGASDPASDPATAPASAAEDETDDGDTVSMASVDTASVDTADPPPAPTTRTRGRSARGRAAPAAPVARKRTRRAAAAAAAAAAPSEASVPSEAPTETGEDSDASAASTVRSKRRRTRAAAAPAARPATTTRRSRRQAAADEAPVTPASPPAQAEPAVAPKPSSTTDQPVAPSLDDPPAEAPIAASAEAASAAPVPDQDGRSQRDPLTHRASAGAPASPPPRASPPPPAPLPTLTEADRSATLGAYLQKLARHAASQLLQDAAAAARRIRQETQRMDALLSNRGASASPS